MANFNRGKWTTILFTAFLAPLTLFVILALRAQMLQQGAATSQPATEAAVGGLLLTPPPATGPTTAPVAATTGPAERPMFIAAGNSKALWLVRPLYTKDVASYQLLRRLSNSGIWSAADMDGAKYGRGFPQGLAASTLEGSDAFPSAYVFARGSVSRFTLDSHDPRPCLPPDHLLLASAASATQIVAVTRGTPPPGAQRPGDRLTSSALAGATTAPSTEPRFPYDAETRPASSQAATTSAPATEPATAALPPLVNAYACRGGRWTVLPPLGPAATEATTNVPGEHAYVTAAAIGDRFIVMWVDPAAPSTLIARSLDTNKPDAQWSEPVTSRLQEPLPPSTRLMAAVLDKTLFVVWPVISSQEMVLRGGWMVTDGGTGDLTLPARNFLPPMSLGEPSSDEAPGNIAIAPAENSLAVIFTNKARDLVCQVFDQHGQPVTKPAAIQAHSPQRDAQAIQNAALVIMLLVLFLSLWQWRQRPMSPKLPSDLAVAPLHLRAAEFAIDLAIPLVVVSLAMGMFDVSSFGAMFTSWFATLANPEELLNASLLVNVLGAYLIHVTLGELFFRRSIGKAVLGLQVLMIDGRAPTVAAILLRNLVRIPELLSGILLVYMFMSQQRQRLGDLFARTLVVSQKTPATPPDPDREEEKTSVGSDRSGDSR